jgi:hypothetical protein
MPYPKVITLPSGKVATIREGKGRDILEAQRAIGTDSNALPYALIARLVLIDGQPIVFEDVLDVLSAADCFELMPAVMTSAVPPRPASSASSPTSTSPQQS